MSYESLSEDNTSCEEEEIINQRYNKKIRYKSNKTYKFNLNCLAKLDEDII